MHITYRVEDYDGRKVHAVHNIQTKEAAVALARRAFAFCPDHHVAVYAVQGPRLQQILELDADSSDCDAGE